MKNHNTSNSESGSAIVMVLLITAVLTSLVYMNMHRKKLIAQQKIQSEIRNDVLYIIETINSILVSPKECNVNFRGNMAINGTLSNIQQCVTGQTCTGASGSGTVVFGVQNNNTTWNFGADGATRRVRVRSISYTRVEAQEPPFFPAFPTPNPTPQRAAKLRVTVELEKNLSMLSILTKPSSTTYTINSNFKTARETYELEAFVITLFTSDGWETWSETNLIRGCATSPTSALLH